MPTPKKGPRFGRDPAHQRLIMANLASSLFEAGYVVTTVNRGEGAAARTPSTSSPRRRRAACTSGAR